MRVFSRVGDGSLFRRARAAAPRFRLLGRRRAVHAPAPARVLALAARVPQDARPHRVRGIGVPGLHALREVVAVPRQVALLARQPVVRRLLRLLQRDDVPLRAVHQTPELQHVRLPAAHVLDVPRERAHAPAHALQPREQVVAERLALRRVLVGVVAERPGQRRLRGALLRAQGCKLAEPRLGGRQGGGGVRPRRAEAHRAGDARGVSSLASRRRARRARGRRRRRRSRRRRHSRAAAIVRVRLVHVEVEGRCRGDVRVLPRRVRRVRLAGVVLHLRGAVVGHVVGHVVLVVLVVLVDLGALVVVVVVILRLPRFGLRGARLEAHGMHRALSQIEELVERGVVFANDALVPLAAHVVHVHVVVVRVVVVARSERKLAAGRLRRVRVFLDQMVVARLPARGADDGETAVFVHGVNRVHAAFEANRAFQRVRARGDCAWAETERRDSVVVVQCAVQLILNFAVFL